MVNDNLPYFTREEHGSGSRRVIFIGCCSFLVVVVIIVVVVVVVVVVVFVLVLVLVLTLVLIIYAEDILVLLLIVLLVVVGISIAFLLDPVSSGPRGVWDAFLRDDSI